MRNLDGAKRFVAAVAELLAIVASGLVMAFVVAGPAWADDPPQVAADSKSSAPTDAPPPEGAPAAPTADAKPAPVPHLSSPDNLPPYTTGTPDGSQDSDRLSYLKDVWHAVQEHDITPNEALVLLAQRPMDADATPPPGMPAGPQQPLPGPVPPAPDGPPQP